MPQWTAPPPSCTAPATTRVIQRPPGTWCARRCGRENLKLARGEPAGRVPDICGPQVMTFADLIRTYMRVARHRRRILQVPMPGRFARAIRNGALLVPVDATPQRAAGRRSWEEFLSERLG
jgi:hypothetical protein